MTETRPRVYRQAVPRLWWLRRRSYLLFMLRELSCVFVVWAVLFLLLLLRAVGKGPVDYQRFLDWAARPWVIAVNVLALAFLVFHSVTWFNLAPKAMVVRVPKRMLAAAPKAIVRRLPEGRVPGWLIVAQNYVAWVLVSAIVAGLVIWSGT
jgi:succinate dehydrogenase subunit C